MKFIDESSLGKTVLVPSLISKIVKLLTLPKHTVSVREISRN